MDQQAKRKAVQDFVNKTNKENGQGVVIFGDTARQACDVISTGSLEIDIATGIGGIPKGRLVEIFGMESGGKTTLSLQAIANCQKMGGSGLFIDVEHALDPGYAKNLGINMDDLPVSQPDSAEQSLTVLKSALVSGAFDLIVVDSVASLIPRAVIDGEIGDAHVGVLARLLSRHGGEFAKLAARSNTAVIFINQIRHKIGGYGNPETTTGGNALKFFASMRIQCTRSTLKKDGEEVLGNTVKIKVIKNKLAPPFKECEPEIIYGEGFSREAEIVKIGSEMDIVEKSGSWYAYKGERIGQGAESARQFFLANPALSDEAETAIKAKLGMAKAA